MEVTLRELLYDEEFIAKLYGWSYNRMFDKVNTEELCQEIILQLLIASQTIEYDYSYAYIWKIAENTYNRTLRQSYKHRNNAEYESYINVNTATDLEDDLITRITDIEHLRFIKSQISYMSKIYRDVMVMFYFDGLQMTEIAEELNIPLNRVKQRLHTAKERIKKEVTNMSNNNLALKPYKFITPGSGNPLKSNIHENTSSILEKNIAYVCKDTAKTPSEIATELSVPTVFIEDMIHDMVGEAIKDCGNGKYIANFIVINSNDVDKITNEIKVVVKDYVTEAIAVLNSRKDEIIGLNYLNPPKSFEFILWTIIPFLSWEIEDNLHNIVTNYFNIENEKRDYKIVGIAYQDEFNFNMYGCNGIMNDQFEFRNFIGHRLPWNKTRFECTEDIPPHIMFTAKCIGGLSKDYVSEEDIEACAKAIDVGYISLADDGKYYPEIVIYDKQNYYPSLPGIGEKYSDQIGQTFIDAVKKYIPEHLMNQKDIFIDIMSAPLMYHIIEEAISQGALYIPEGDTIVEGIWGVKR